MEATDMPVTAIVGGSGWLGGIMAERFLTSSLLTPEKIRLTGQSARSAGLDEWPEVSIGSDNVAAVKNAEIVILAVRPEALAGLKLDLSDRLVISVIAGVRCEALRLQFPEARVVRCMPNSLARFGYSFTPWFGSKELGKPDCHRVKRLLQSLGHSERISAEIQLEALTLITGSGEAFPALVASTIIDCAITLGLDADLAKRAILHNWTYTMGMLSKDNSNPSPAYS